MATFEEQWDELKREEADVYNSLTPAQRNKLVRRFAQRVARKEVGSGDQRLKDFLSTNLSPIQGEQQATRLQRMAAGIGDVASTIGGILPSPSQVRSAVSAIGEEATTLIPGYEEFQLTPQQRTTRSRRMAQPLAPGSAASLARAARETLQQTAFPTVQMMAGPSVTAAMQDAASRSPDIATRLAQQQADVASLKAPLPPKRPITQTIAETAGQIGSAIAEPIREAISEPSRFLPGSPGFAEGLTAAGVSIPASFVDPLSLILPEAPAVRRGAMAAQASSTPATAAARPVSTGINLAQPQATISGMRGMAQAPTVPPRVAAARAAAEGRQVQVRAARGLPAPGQTAGPPIFSEQALAGQVISPEMASSQFQRALQARMAAEQRVNFLAGKKSKQADIDEANAVLDAAMQNEEIARALAQSASMRAAAAQQRPIRLGEPQPPREPLALPEPSGPPLIPAQGMSEQALYGAPPGPPPIVTPPPVMRPQLPPPSGPEIMPPPAPMAPSAFALEGMAGQRPPGIPAGYTPSTALVPLPRPIEAYPPGYFLGQQAGERPPGMPLPSALRPPLEPPPPMMPPSRQLEAPSGPPVMPETQVPPVPRYVGQAPAAGAERALFGQIGGPETLPATRQGLEQIAATAANERFVLQQQLDALPPLPPRATRAQMAERNATEMNLRQGIIDAGERQMEALRRLGSLAPEPRPVAPPPAPAAAPRGKKKAPTDLADTPLGRLMLGEEGAATPAAMLGAAGTLPAAALGVLYRGLRAGGQGLAAVARSPQFGRAAEALQAIPNTTARIGQMVEGAIPPELAAAITKVRALPVEVASGVENAIANRFPAVGRAMDAALRFTITNYGKPEAYIRLEEAAANAGRQIENNLANFGIRIFDTLGNDAARMARLYDDMTAESYVPGSNTVDDALVMEGRALTADVGRHLVRIGALTPEAFAQWGGRYLPRIYEKVLRQAREDGVTNAFVRFFQDDPTLAGYYHRGLRETVSQAEAARRIASGQWQELSRTGTGKVVVWRDWTAAERAKWGELKNVSASLEKYAGAARREIQNGTFLEGIRTGSDSAGAWALDANSLFPGQPKTMRPADFTDAAGNRYIYIGDTARKGGAIKKFGTLSDHYVRDDINAHLMFTHELGSFKQGVRIAKKISGVNWWKKLVTIGSPTYFANNFFVNMPMLELAGGSIADIPKAVNMIAAGDPLIADLASRGLIQDGLALRQLAQRTNPIIERAAGSTSPAGIAGAISRAGAALKRYEAGAYNVAGASDDIFRVALVKALRDRHKMSIDDAVEVANTAFYNREKVKAPIVDMLEPIIPFAAVTHWSMSSLPKLMWQNPVKAAYLGTLAAALPYVTETFYGVKPEKARAMQELLPQQMRPGLGLGFPNSVLAGYDDKGQPIYVDLASFNPVSMFTAEVPVGPSQAWPRALSPGGPATIAAQLLSNKDWYTGKKLVELDERGRRQVIDDTLLSQIPGVGELAPTEVRQFLGRALIPGVVRMPFEAARAAAAQAVSPETAVSLGLTSGQSVPISLGTRVARMAGLKARPLNPQEMFARELGIEETSLAGIRKSQGAALRRYERAVQAGNDAEAADALQKWTAYETMKQSVMMQESERQQRLAPALE